MNQPDTDRIASSRQAADRLREAGLRATAPRVAILTALSTDRRHPSAEMLLESLRPGHPSLSLSTVYTTLEVLAQRGLIRRLGAQGDRMRVDGTARDHDHAICRECGAIFDVDRGVLPRPSPPVTLPDGLHVEDVHIEYEVICAACGRGD
jgi:Fe2+ or Zn2+ uptake regulation protein